jgi:hypothetical protein
MYKNSSAGFVHLLILDHKSYNYSEIASWLALNLTKNTKETKQDETPLPHTGPDSDVLYPVPVLISLVRFVVSIATTVASNGFSFEKIGDEEGRTGKDPSKADSIAHPPGHNQGVDGIQLPRICQSETTFSQFVDN